MQKIPTKIPGNLYSPQLTPKIDQLKEKENIQKLPTKVYCPVCGEKMIFLSLTPQEAQGARASGALQAAKLQSNCGTMAVLTLRITPQGLNLYSMTFWIVPRAQMQNNVLSPSEIGKWSIDIGQNKHFPQKAGG